jgi:cytochrome c oxidase subunit 3
MAGTKRNKKFLKMIGERMEMSESNKNRDDLSNSPLGGRRGDQRKKIHPHKFTLWVALGSIIMMFAGLTSAYIVKRDQPGWTSFTIPKAFWYSTAVILVSSLTIQMALKAFKEREMLRYRNLIAATALLGVGFLLLQWSGFRQIWNSGVTFRGSGGGQFLYIIAGLHGLHALAGVIALLVLLIRAFAFRIRSYNSVPVELMSTYWHFVDLLWIYLFIFFNGIN